ncbi:MAG TPA: hypothetical protein EYO46_09400 [Candidatus Lambdaproteobacteria bacterium]|nr:hypothetical protein [Candidatus Lambdaproteobacteria bacterium]
MTAAKITEYNLLSCLEISHLLDSVAESRIWFTQLNLHNFTKNELPDAGQIADYLFSAIELPELKLFLLLIEKKRKEPWTGNTESVGFQELIEIKILNTNEKKQNTSFKMRGCVWKNKLDPETIQEIIIQNPDAPLVSVAKNRHAVIVNPEQPLRLEVLKIPKPWGHEGWYTGVEKRGVVKVTDECGKTELPYALNLLKKQLLAEYAETLILLKSLNPVAEVVVGDLYYEMHEEKWEVYVVTEIDKNAWPSGTGIIKAGLHPDKISEYQAKHGKKWSEYLLKDFKEAIAEYEKIRRQIDDYKEIISQELSDQEHALRERAAAFVGDFSVKVGDIVSFPVFQMHSLRHGIKVIEFQTPHYERLILMNAQKVLTQNHWDTEDALNKMIPQVYEAPQLERLHKSAGLLVERFVDFPQFTADRISLDAKAIWAEQLDGQYRLLITISGQATVFPENGNPVILNHEEALFLPVGMGSYRLKSTGNIPLICLKAMPK